MNDKTKKILLTVAGVFVVLIIILFIISSCSNKKFNFTKFQDEMVTSAKNYYKNKSDELPTNGASKTVTINELVNGGYMKDPAVKYKKSKITCDGSVTVFNNDGLYVYTPSATCGKDYKTSLLIDVIQDNSLVESGEGLYKVDNELIFKGKNVNNYVAINGSDKLFRIIKVNSNGTFRLIEEKGLDHQSWDTNYNTERHDNTGINDYIHNGNNSKAKESLINYYNDTSVWTNDIKSYVLTQDLCIGKRDENDATKDGSTECSVLLNNQKLGLIAVYEYLQLSLDENCNSTGAVACQNYNWLTEGKLWTLTGDSANSAKVYWKWTSIERANASSSKSLNAVFNIPGTVTAVQGNGSQGDPYIIR